MKRFLYALLLCAFAVCGATANNIRIIGIPTVTDQDTVKNTVHINFDLAWANSWRTSKPDNHDAAWLFVKCWDGEAWNHVYLMDDKNSYRAGSKTAADAVNYGKDNYMEYKVTSRDGKTDLQMDMVLEPGYAMAYKKWHLDPTEKEQVCCVGFFLYRKDYGAGDVSVPGIQFTWNYDDQGFVDDDDLVVKVFAVEMVYVPQGAFYLGGKGTATYQVGSFTTNGATFGTPMVITSEDAITVKNSAEDNTLWAADNAITEGTIPAKWPKGYNAFYIMKYEMSQQAYCEFLNTLQQGQQNGRTNYELSALAVGHSAWSNSANALSAYRNFVEVRQSAPVVIFGMDANNNNIWDETDRVEYPKGSGDTLTRNIDGQDLAMNFISVRDLLAYAEFAGLRPMTEFEYEKACRGPREPARDEYAWGSNTKVFFGMSNNGNGDWISPRVGITDYNTGTERIPGGYNVGFVRGSYYANSGWWTRWQDWYTYPAVFRVGVFADSTTTRAAAGATFWGVMNMSDNTAEICISAVDTIGRKFVGTHGCGQLDGFGEAMNKDWNIPTDNNAFHYYITRGMWFFYYYQRHNYGGCGGLWGDPRGVSANWIWLQANSDNNYGYAGMISSRHRWNQTVMPLNERNCTSGASSNAMIGIRCVRSAPCKGNEKPL